MEPIDKDNGSSSSVKPDVEQQQFTALAVVGHVLLNHRQYDKAISIFEALFLIDPANCFVLRSLTYLYVESGRYVQAIEFVRKHEALQPNSESTGILCGLLESRALWSLERHVEARECFKNYLQRAWVID